MLTAKVSRSGSIHIAPRQIFRTHIRGLMWLLLLLLLLPVAHKLTQLTHKLLQQLRGEGMGVARCGARCRCRRCRRLALAAALHSPNTCESFC